MHIMHICKINSMKTQKLSSNMTQWVIVFDFVCVGLQCQFKYEHKFRTCCFISDASSRLTSTLDNRVEFWITNAVIGIKGSKIIWNICHLRNASVPCLQHRESPDFTDTRLDSSSAELCELCEFVSILLPVSVDLALERWLRHFLLAIAREVADIVSTEDPVMIEGCRVRSTCFGNKLSSISVKSCFLLGTKHNSLLYNNLHFVVIIGAVVKYHFAFLQRPAQLGRIVDGFTDLVKVCIKTFEPVVLGIWWKMCLYQFLSH